MKKRDCIVFDIDGTLMDITERRKILMADPDHKDWAGFNANMHLDTPHVDMIQLCNILRQAGHLIVLVSGRGEESRGMTTQQLVFNGVVFEELFMRKAGDYRPDDIVKEEILDQMLADGWFPIMVFDDRDRVVAMWRRRGFRCFQVAEGHF
jgi:hypothetical protein